MGQTISASLASLLPRKPEQFNYEWLGFLGKGGNGTVYMVKYHGNNPSPGRPEKLAAKIFKKPHQSNRKEFDKLELFKGSPYVIQTYGFYEEVNGSNVLLMELAEGKSFMQLIIDRATRHPAWRPDEQFCRTYFGMMLCALESVHRTGYCHRDVKMENFVLTESGKIKLIDFDTIVKSDQNNRLKQAVGTSSFWAEECFECYLHGKDYNGLKADVFALGVCLFQMWALSFPFGKRSAASLEQYYALYSSKYTRFCDDATLYFEEVLAQRSPTSLPLPESLQELLASMLAPEDRRITLAQVRQSAWFQQAPKVDQEGLQSYFTQLTGKTPTIIGSEIELEFQARGATSDLLSQYGGGLEIDLKLLPAVASPSSSCLLTRQTLQDFISALRCMFEPKDKTVKVFPWSCYEKYRVHFDQKTPDRATIEVTIEQLRNKESGTETSTGSVCIRMGFDPKDMLVVDIFPEEDTLEIGEFVPINVYIVNQLNDLLK